MSYRRISIVIPIYNERASIEQVLTEVKKARVAGLEKEIVLVDDCSTDGTREFLTGLHDPELRVFYHETNQGKGAALHTGFRAATGDLVIIQDADLEYNPHEIGMVIGPILTGKAHVVYGSRYLRKDTTLKFWHSSLNQLFTHFSNFLIGQNLTDIMTCYKAFTKEALGKVVARLESKRFGFEPEVTAKISKAGYRIVEVPVSYKPRRHDQGKHMNFRGQMDSLFALLRYTFFS